MPRLVLHLFGSPHMEIDGAVVEVDTRKATALLAYLAVSGTAHQRDSLAVLLWPDYDQTSARAALRRTLSTLNRALVDRDTGDGHILDITRESIGLSAQADYWLDVKEFRQQLTSLSTHGHAANAICPACLPALEAAAALYSGPFMAGFNLRDSTNFEEWQFFQEETLRRELAGVFEQLVSGLAACGRLDEAIGFARRWLALDPLIEEPHRQLMLLYAHTDGRNAALRQYRECVRILDQELGVTPLEETTSLYQAILNREPLPELSGRFYYLSTEPPAPQPLPEQMPGDQPPLAAPLDDAARELYTALPPLIGRDGQLAELIQTYQGLKTDGCFVALNGEAGIGKTRLAETFLAKAREQGAQVFLARCYAGEAGLAYAPFIEGLFAALAYPETTARLQSLPGAVLAEASRLLPAVLAAGQRAGEINAFDIPAAGDGAQARFFEALRQVIITLVAGPHPGILFLDDFHWADTASLDLLTYLARRLRNLPLLIITTWRREAGDTTHRLETLAGELNRLGQSLRLNLDRMDLAQVEALVQNYPGMATGAHTNELAKRLYKESEGLPFVAVEYLSALAARGALNQGEGNQQDWEMPAGVRDLLHSRLSGLDPAAQQLISTAAVIGRSFDFNTLRDTSGRSDFETIEGLEKLLASGLVIEQGAGSTADVRYDFTHEKLRELIYEDTSLARRRLLHRRAAETLAKSQSGRLEQAGLVAYHFAQAGNHAQAAEYHLLAGERARRLFANMEALAQFQAALAAGHPDVAGLHEAIGDLRTLRGEYAAALVSYQTASAMCSPGCLANLEYKLGSVHQRLGEWDLAESHYQASLEALDEDDPAINFRVRLHANRSLVAHMRGDLHTAEDLARQSLHLAQQVNDPTALAQANNTLGVLARARHEQEQAIAYLEASLSAAETLDDPLAQIAALNNLALAHGEHGSLDQAIKLARQALSLCQKRGDRHREAALHNNLADLFHRAGREEEAMEQLKQAVVIFAEIGAPVEGALPEIWKLTEW
jgi:predicted ATPase/DNA-binding SARP family transcriptional activator